MINIERVKNIILTPKTEWDTIKNEESTLGNILGSYVIPTLLIPSLAAFIGFWFIGKPIAHTQGYYQHSFGIGFSAAISTFLGSIICVSLASVIIDSLAHYFDSEKNLNRTAQLVAYSYTPVWAAGVLYLIPVFGDVGQLACFFSLYVMYHGLGPMKNTPEDKKVPYVAVSFILIVILTIIVSKILLSILELFGLGMNAGYSIGTSL
jgi:hypothetical protein